ncbi:type II toxin-antitoxin system RelE/ParE family toxin [Rhizobium tubonense]|uniref:Plasmid stabilization protein ParE n=1 Tax=Rhizobium tubonense TaxID=484088 RepID=A0A2W4CL81_9HYPH|nr:type II toxin-antitoxin system RelE/ParE family toxin [Rhizobium tubonense]PZM13697.1 plasmid stabilization protein ParE [Rhizobium tubonense]
MEYRIDFHPAAEQELADIYEYIADQSGATRAWNFVSGIRDHCTELTTFPERGTRRDDLRPGLRIIGHRRRVSIAFSVKNDSLRILGIFYAGRQISAEILEQRE